MVIMIIWELKFISIIPRSALQRRMKLLNDKNDKVWVDQLILSLSWMILINSLMLLAIQWFPTLLWSLYVNELHLAAFCNPLIHSK